ncbi:T9SS type A sorting domain-containing protein [Ignavibacterium sp.]|uniref:T9SS type A sorting domain-containing protein n=1 Tax=Ignavibacterium sp. TaxID=2651167 RepID=UPI00307F936A
MKIINKFFSMTVLLLIVIASESFAQLAAVDSVIEGNINTSAFLSKNKRYLLSGFVNVNSPAILTIQAGTVIYGEKVSKGTLIINRGAKLIADGTANEPIVFTSQELPGNRGPGDWGGIIIAGNATINVPGGTATLEGGTGTIYGGGATPNDNDNSGILRYVRIEFPGIAFLPDNEINGLTLGGIGNATIIENVQVSYSGDDSFEWFGGTANAKNLISFRGVDDDFDMDFGFRGNIQFAFAVRDPNIADISGSNGFETDNDGTGTFNTPRTLPVISNFTVVGPMPDTSFTAYNPNFRRGAHIRRSALTSIYNSIVMGFPIGLLLDGSGVGNAALGDTLQIRNSIWAGLRAGNGIITNYGPLNALSWYDTPAFGNRRYVQPAEVGLSDPFNLSNPNLVPSSGSPAATGASFTNPRLVGFFTPTTYVGAFDPSGNRWDLPWANYDPQNTNYVLSVEENQLSSLPTDFTLSQNYPNPFNPSTKIIYSVSQPAKVKLYVTNILGQIVEELVNEYRETGTYEINYNAENLTTGLYIYTLEAGNTKLSRKMTLLK